MRFSFNHEVMQQSVNHAHANRVVSTRGVYEFIAHLTLYFIFNKDFIVKWYIKPHK